MIKALLLALACTACTVPTSTTTASTTADACSTAADVDALVNASDLDARTWLPSGSLPQAFADPLGFHATVALQFPTTYDADPSIPRPLYIFLHSYSNQSEPSLQSRWGLMGLKDLGAGALVLSPRGNIATDGHLFWAASTACCNVYDLMRPDSAYIAGLITRVRAAGWNVGSVYLWGASNGAFMALREACDHPELVSAVVAVSGAANAMGDAACVPGHVPVMEVHGTGDKSVRWLGGSLFGLTPFPAVEGPGGTLDQLASRNECTGTLDLFAIGLDYDSIKAGAEGEDWRYSGCPTRGEVRHLRLIGSPHSPAPTPLLISTMLAFSAQY